jgi:hypothetical protein
MLRDFIHRLNDDSKQVLVAANLGLTALSTHVSTEELVKHIEFIRNLIASMVSDARRRKGGVGDGEFLLPGFNMPKGQFMLIFDITSINMSTSPHLFCPNCCPHFLLSSSFRT